MIAPFVRLALVAAFAAAAIPLTGCAPVIVAGAAGAALVATDRRSVGAQLDDTTIETKLAASYTSTWGDRAHVSVTSYNGVVLLSGEVPDQAAWAEAGSRAKATDRVRAVHNELAWRARISDALVFLLDVREEPHPLLAAQTPPHLSGFATGTVSVPSLRHHEIRFDATAQLNAPHWQPLATSAVERLPWGSASFTSAPSSTSSYIRAVAIPRP